MAKLKMVERTQLEDLFGMASGYVLDFSNNTFRTFIQETAGIDIDADRYSVNGTSKAKRLRVFRELESDDIVAKVISELLVYWEYKNPQPDARSIGLHKDCKAVAERLLGKKIDSADSEKEFLEKRLESSGLKDIPMEASLLPILEARLGEAVRTLEHGAPLSAIFMCGSILEGLLLGCACSYAKEFNQAPNSPKDRSGKVKQFHEWRLAELIDVACEVGRLALDVKKFSHSLRDFRNFIHPWEQMRNGFNPDSHTARISLQVLYAAIASLGGKR